MTKAALFITRDTTGLVRLGKALCKRGYRLLAIEPAAKEFEAASLEHISFSAKEALVQLSDKQLEVELVFANFRDPQEVERNYTSWKSAFCDFDFELVAAIRLAAKQLGSIAIIGDPNEYDDLIIRLEKGDSVLYSESEKVELAARALSATADFDIAVARFLETSAGDRPDLSALSGYPKTLRSALPRSRIFPYGENPHQKAALYGSFFDSFQTLTGPDLSYETVLNLNVAACLIGEFQKPTLAFSKKGMAISAVSGETLEEAFEKLSDRGQLSGTALAVNMTLHEGLAKELSDLDCAIILAPRFSEAVICNFESSILITSKEGVGYESLLETRSVIGGVLAQDKDFASINPMQWQLPTRAQPLVDQWSDLIFAARFIRHVRSSACVVVKDERIVSLAFSQPDQSLAWSAMASSEENLAGTILAFDEPIGERLILEEAKNLGIEAVLHPGHEDSQKDDSLASRADDLGMALVKTGFSSRKLM